MEELLEPFTVKETAMPPSNQIKVSRCRMCPFYFAGTDGRECTHHFFRGMDDAYAGFIIKDSNSIPDKCPLHMGVTIILVELDKSVRRK